MTTPPAVPGPDPKTRPPKFRPPAGATDCHFHVFGPEADYPYAERRRYTPVQTLESDYLRMAGILGLERGVVVQASPYGADNARTLEAIRVLGPGYAGVGVVAPDVSGEELEELTRGGVRGARVNAASGGESGIGRMGELAARVRDFGWHVQLHLRAEQLFAHEREIRKLPVDVVFDHMGLFPAHLPLTHPWFRALLGLLEGGRAWVKLSGADRVSRRGAPYRDAVPIARALCEAAPDRVVWGTDWPHANVKPRVPNDGDLMDLLAEFAPDERTRRKLLVENPAALYGFDRANPPAAPAGG